MTSRLTSCNEFSCFFLETPEPKHCISPFPQRPLPTTVLRRVNETNVQTVESSALLQSFIQVTTHLSKGGKCCRDMDGSRFWRFDDQVFISRVGERDSGSAHQGLASLECSMKVYFVQQNLLDRQQHIEELSIMVKLP